MAVDKYQDENILPVEIWFQIYNNLSPNNLLQMNGVSKFFQQTIPAYIADINKLYFPHQDHILPLSAAVFCREYQRIYGSLSPEVRELCEQVINGKISDIVENPHFCLDNIMGTKFNCDLLNAIYFERVISPMELAQSLGKQEILDLFYEKAKVEVEKYKSDVFFGFDITQKNLIWKIMCHQNINDVFNDANINSIICKESSFSLLHLAVSMNHFSLVKELIKNKADINLAVREEKETPLTVACARGTVKMLDYLLAHNADVIPHLNEQNTYLHIACRNNRGNIVKKLLTHPLTCKMDINTVNSMFHTPLSQACYHLNIPLIRTLLQHGASLYEPDIISPLAIVCSRANRLMFEKLEHHLQGDIFKPMLGLVAFITMHGGGYMLYRGTLLHAACERGNVKMVHYLLERGFDINHKAFLVNCEASPRVSKVEDVTPLEIALLMASLFNFVSKSEEVLELPEIDYKASNYQEVIKLLLENNAEISDQALDLELPSTINQLLIEAKEKAKNEEVDYADTTLLCRIS